MLAPLVLLAVSASPAGAAPAQTHGLYVNTGNSTLELPLAVVEAQTGLILLEDRLPLRTKGRYIVDKFGGRVKWSCVNWHGGQQRSWVMGGLHKQPLDALARRIAGLGFNCVRLVYSTEGVLTNPKVPADRLAANPSLIGCTFLECMDAVVKALTHAHVMVILNNHLSSAGWCCNIKQDEGLWYTDAWNASQWQSSVVLMASRYKSNPWVVAHDLRNEPHRVGDTDLTWGTGDPKTDYLLAMETAGNAVLDVAPDVLIVIEAMCFGMELRMVKERPVRLKLPDRIVYEVHNYQEFQFSTLFTSHFYAWSYVQHVLELAVGLLIFIFIALGYGCSRLKWPWAPRGVFLTSFGAWFVAVMTPALGVAIGGYVYYLTYCSLISTYDILDWIKLFSVGLLLGIVLIVSGLMRAGHCRFAYRQLCSDGQGPARSSGRIKKTPTDSDDSSDSEADADSYIRGRAETDDESEHIEDLACLNLFVRAKVETPGGPCCYRGWRSCRQAASRTVGREWRTKGLPRVMWDCGTCCMLQACIGIPMWIAVIVCLWFYAVVAPTYVKIESELDKKWGFVLHDGHEFTAPVWMGEFGAGEKGTYWVNFVRYLSERDLEWAYWPLNPDKLATGWFDDWGHFHQFTEGARWEEDSYSILDLDYMTVRHPWRVLDMKPLMQSPAGAVLNSQPCQRSVLGRTCGG